MTPAPQGIRTNWVVLTGAPSSGKTSVLNVLARCGYAVQPEVARSYMEACIAAGIPIEEVRRDKASLQREILRLKAEREAALDPGDIVFLDRAIPDSISYFRAARVDASDAIAASRKYRYREIFLFDRLPFVQDGIRTEERDMVDYLDRQLEADYRLLGYAPVRVPVMAIEERANFILQTLGLSCRTAAGG